MLVCDVVDRQTTVRKHNQLMRLLLRESLELHRDVRMRQHFSTSAYQEYGYAPRSKGYQLRKAKKKGHQRPWVWTGETERTMHAGSVITATKDRGRLRFRVRFPLTLQRRRELESFSAKDVDEIKRRLKTRYGEMVKLPEWKETRRRRIR